MRDDAPSGQNAAYIPDTQGLKTIGLRILATTDLHMQLLGYDYISDTKGTHHGLAGIATLIKSARHDAREQGFASVLLDNGDLFQGGPLADLFASNPADTDNPTIAALNQLEYDAIGLGNHDLDYGIDFLHALTERLNMPVIASNLELNEKSGLCKSTILNLEIPNDPAGKLLGVGIVSVLPVQTAIWNAPALENKGKVMPALATVRRMIPILRAKGADVVIVLAHMGIRNGEKESALTLAQHAGADAVIAGHTHRRFPGEDHRQSAQVDPHHGMLALCPASMPGYGGSDLGVLDLKLARGPSGRWALQEHHSALVPNTPDTVPTPEIVSLCRASHDIVRARMSHQIGQTTTAFHNYFSLAMPTTTALLLAAAKAHAIRTTTQSRTKSNLPIIAATPARTAGGLSGPTHYLNIPKGPVLRRHLAGLAPYRDEIWGIDVTGKMVREWLETSANIFHRLSTDDPDQPLVRGDVPPFNFDTIFGLKYEIDPTRPAGERIRNLRHNATPVSAEQRFLLATSQFRASGGGGLLPNGTVTEPYRSEMALETALAEVLQHPALLEWTDPTPWRFAPAHPVKAILETTPMACAHLDEAKHLTPRCLGRNVAGFARIQLSL